MALPDAPVDDRYGPDMSALVLSVECGGGLAYHPIFGEMVSAKRCDECPGGETRPGLLGGWQCSCECHRTPSDNAGSVEGDQ